MSAPFSYNIPDRALARRAYEMAKDLEQLTEELRPHLEGQVNDWFWGYSEVTSYLLKTSSQFSSLDEIKDSLRVRGEVI